MRPLPVPFVRLLLAWALCLPFGRAQDAPLRETFLQAKVMWATQGDKDGASARFEQVIGVLEPKASSLDAAWLQVLCESYNWLAILDDRTPAKRPRVQKDLEAILHLDPGFEVDRNVTNARLLGVFEGLRGTRLGWIRISLKPAGGTLTLDDKPCSLDQKAVKYLLPGPHVFRYSKPGYQTLEYTAEIALKENRPLDAELVRTSSTLTFNTFPSGAEILLDGRSLGTSSGHAPASAAARAANLGLAVEQLSDDFVLVDLAPGKHLIEVRAPCFQTKRISLGEELTTPFADHLLEPFKLEPSSGTLSVSSDVPGGELLLSGRSLGPLPVKDAPVCPGSYLLQVKFAAGGYSQPLDVEEGKTVELRVMPRPRLAYLGFEGTEDFAGRDRILGMLQNLGPRLKEVVFTPPSPNESIEEASRRLKAGREAEMILVARPVPGRPAGRIELVVSTLGGEEERTLVKPLEVDPLEALVARLNARAPLWEPWIGLTLVDLPGETGPWVLEADAVAQQAGVKAFKAVTTLNGKPVATVRDFKKRLKESMGGQVLVGQGGTEAALVPTLQPVEIPVNASNLCYPALLADLRLRQQGAKGDEAALLRLQQALALMHFHQYDKAMEVLRDARLSTSAGVCQGTLDYYAGASLLRLGTTYLEASGQAFNRSLKYPQATLFGPDGPRVSILAKQALENLKP
ncbi:MAG TPA: hypothetical protein PLA48_12720 [Holophaga sp.]|nr:hypothetical protein [Holophaga sp.]